MEVISRRWYHVETKRSQHTTSSYLTERQSHSTNTLISYVDAVGEIVSGHPKALGPQLWTSMEVEQSA
jgi:hypothetical protein